MIKDSRPGRRPGRRGPEVRCRTGAASGRSASWPPGTPDLEIDVARVHGDLVVVAVTGEIDLHTADALRARLVGLHGAGFRRLVVDFGAVPFCDAAGLGALVAARNQIAGDGGEIRLVRVRPAQLRLLRITGLHRLFPLYVNVNDATHDSPTTFQRG